MSDQEIMEMFDEAKLVVAGSGDIIGPEHRRSAYIDRFGSCALAGIPPNMMSEDVWKGEFEKYEGTWQNMWQDFVEAQTGYKPSKDLVEMAYKNFWANTATIDGLPATLGIYELMEQLRKQDTDFAIVSGQFKEINEVINRMYNLGIDESRIIETQGNGIEEVYKGYRKLGKIDGPVVILDGNTKRMGYINELNDEWVGKNGWCRGVFPIGVKDNYVTMDGEKLAAWFGNLLELDKALDISVDRKRYGPGDSAPVLEYMQRLANNREYKSLIAQWYNSLRGGGYR
ncbi:MAG: hypothetical protein GXO64_03205 [Candidatus Micrarchaeota archaeon]|nr:hypothetical protein [Candidatus Micrarchaeota archaeon]